MLRTARLSIARGELSSRPVAHIQSQVYSGSLGKCSLAFCVCSF